VRGRGGIAWGGETRRGKGGSSLVHSSYRTRCRGGAALSHAAWNGSKDRRFVPHGLLPALSCFIFLLGAHPDSVTGAGIGVADNVVWGNQTLQLDLSMLVSGD
jgi:hypothetical protein